MPGKHLFEYAAIRVVPRVEREEFMNVGVLLYCKSLRFLGVLFTVDKSRLLALCPHLDVADIEQHLHSLKAICEGEKNAGPIAVLEQASRFRWLTATRSTIIQTSKVHPGFCTNAQETLEKLYAQLVL